MGDEAVAVGAEFVEGLCGGDGRPEDAYVGLLERIITLESLSALCFVDTRGSSWATYRVRIRKSG